MRANKLTSVMARGRQLTHSGLLGVKRLPADGNFQYFLGIVIKIK
jgi:hypothetical protein